MFIECSCEIRMVLLHTGSMKNIMTLRILLIQVIVGNNAMSKNYGPCKQKNCSFYLNCFPQSRIFFKYTKLILYRYFRKLQSAPNSRAIRNPVHQSESYHDLTSVTFIPAFTAASMPRSASSKTSINSGSTCINSAHLRKVSG